MRATLAACVLMLAANSASAQFELDISSSDFHRMYGNGTISDLAVDERGYIDSSAVCAEDGSLFVMAYRPLLEQSESFNLLLVHRLAKNNVEVSISLKSGASEPREERVMIIRGLANAGACAASRVGRPDFEILQIQTIDGHGTLSELLG